MELALLRAARIFGTQRKLAKIIGASPEQVNSWLNKNIQIPLEYALEIARATQHKVKWDELTSKKITEHVARANTPLTNTMGYYIELSHIPVQKIKSSYTDLTGDKKIDAMDPERPICVDENNKLIFGINRLRLYQKQQQKRIPARRLSLSDLIKNHYNTTDLINIFDLIERTVIGIKLESFIGNRQGQRLDLNKPMGNFPEVIKKGTTTRDFIATLLGFNNEKKFRQLKKILHQGNKTLIENLRKNKINLSKAVKLLH
ncbi:MAG: YdaS family helix-turn-helix protein [Pseudomonadota bacterium]